jgi:putative sterol carrier protein
MADTAGFFNEYLPTKLVNKPDLVKIGKSIVFDINGAGIWSLDLTGDTGTCVEGRMENPDCTITAEKDDWEKLLDKPALGMQLFMMGKIKADNLGVATQLQKILS